MTEEAQFTFSWRALKLLGRGLYSNPWSALSELAANGFDAGANRVYVYIDARAKARATVEVIDNGIGMSRSDINAYVQVGRDKREDGLVDGADPKPKGRKGIGKLAALFLSSRFSISTMQEGRSTHWALDAREGHINDDEHPHLVSTATTESTPNDALWEGFTSGTRVTMLDVDLTGYGPSALSALNLRLANQFLIEDDSPQQIYLWVRNFNDSDDPNYQAVKKSIAFRNMTEAIFNFSSGTPIPPELAGEPHHLTIPAPNLPQGRYKHTFIRKPFELPTELGNEFEDLAASVNLEEQTYEGRDYELTGWIGIHSTIDITEAQLNDDRFMRNRFYNPAHIRLYVRGKLASDSLLADLGLTGTYANYIEGELSFDLLDDDSLPDIATANRQSFDETDSRILLLKALVTPLVSRLMLNRNALAREIAKLSANEQQRRQVAGKTQFNEQLWDDLSRYKDLSEGDRNDLQVVISNKIQGDIRPKDTYRVFISHASSDALFASFIDDLLQSHGATDDEIFFTSRHGSTRFSTDAEALSDIIKRNITDDNTLVFYLTSKHFLNSQYCLFEGGAGWATRAVSEYLKLNVEYSTIPGWLKNGRGEVSILSSDGTIELTETLHNYLVDGILNPMVEHLNRGRVISGGAPISPFERANVPSRVILARDRKNPSDYYDSDVAEHWKHGIQPDKDEYLKHYTTP